MATATIGSRVLMPCTLFLPSVKNPVTRLATTGKVSRLARQRIVSISIRLPDSSKPLNAATATSTCTSAIPLSDGKFTSLFGPDEPRNVADVLVEALERYACPGGAPVEIHQSLTRSVTVRNIVCSHEQGEIFAAEGYDRVSGKPGVCIATSGPGATNHVSGLADALLDSVPFLAMSRTGAFQGTPFVEVTLTITKHNFLAPDVEDIPWMQKDFVIEVPVCRPAVSKNKPPLDSYSDDLLYGGRCFSWSTDFGKLVEFNGIHAANTLIRLGAYPLDDSLSLRMLGMHGTPSANYAVQETMGTIGFSDGIEELMEQLQKRFLWFKAFGDAIPPQYLIKVQSIW